MFQHGHPSMSATECTNLHLKNSMEYSSLGNGTRFHNTCGTPGGHQKKRSDRENTRVSALQKWCPPLLRVLNINSHESGGHRPLRTSNTVFSRSDRIFWCPPGVPQMVYRVLKSRTNIENTKSLITFQKIKNTNGKMHTNRCQLCFCNEAKKDKWERTSLLEDALRNKTNSFARIFSFRQRHQRFQKSSSA